MSDVRETLAARLGGEVKKEGLQPFEVSTPGGARNAVLDPHNLRLKLYGLTAADLDAPDVVALVKGLGDAPDLYTKLTVYALPGDEEDWVRRLFLREGAILGYFPGHLHADLWARYADEARLEAPRDAEHDEIVAMASDKEACAPALPTGYTCRLAEPDDVPALSMLLRATFSDYPVPLDPDTLGTAIAEKANLFRCVFDVYGALVAAASAELDHTRASAEMTDCATDPSHRGRGLMAYILWCLEQDVRDRFGITDLYTLARADEPGMNCVFSRLGYRYTGRLVNNCRMPNGWESMNVWCRVRGVGDDADR